MRRLLALVVLASLATIAACDSDPEGADATPSPTPTAEATQAVAPPSPTASPPPPPESTAPSPPGPRRTGDPALDAIIEAVEARSVAALTDLLERTEVECRVDAGMSWWPECAENEAPGTPVSAFVVLLGCEGGLVRDVEDVVADWVSDVDGFWAGVTPGEFFDSAPWAPPDSLLVFHDVVDANGSSMHLAKYLAVRNGRVIAVGGSCGSATDPMLGGLAVDVTHGPWHEPDFSGPRRTGDPTLDAIIEAVEDRDLDTLVTRLRTEVVECRDRNAQTGIGAPPTCEDEGVPAGTQLTVANVAQCEGHYTTDPRDTLGRWLDQQDGLYGVAPGPQGDQLIFHGVLSGLNAGKSLWVDDGEIVSMWFGCSQPADAVVAPEVLSAGPWTAPLTPRVDAVRTLVAPFLDAIEAGNAAVLVEATEHNFLGHGCTTSRDPAPVLNAFVEADPQLVGIYEPRPRDWLDQWWLVFRLNSGDHARLLVDVGPRVEALFQPCDATLERITVESNGDPARLLWEPGTADE